MQVTNLKFTEEELESLKNSHFFQIKLAVTRKIIELFGALESELKEAVATLPVSLGEEINIKNGKIFRGENYLNLPYIVLDYPRQFSTESIFAFRTMFWWGNGYSFTLHLQGLAWENRKIALIRNLDKLKGNNLYLCINNTPWQYHFEKQNYIKLDQFLKDGRSEELMDKEFIKIASRLDVDQYENVIDASVKTFQLVLSIDN